MQTNFQTQLKFICGYWWENKQIATWNRLDMLDLKIGKKHILLCVYFSFMRPCTLFLCDDVFLPLFGFIFFCCSLFLFCCYYRIFLLFLWIDTNVPYDSWVKIVFSCFALCLWHIFTCVWAVITVKKQNKYWSFVSVTSTFYSQIATEQQHTNANLIKSHAIRLKIGLLYIQIHIKSKEHSYCYVLLLFLVLSWLSSNQWKKKQYVCRIFHLFFSPMDVHSLVPLYIFLFVSVPFIILCIHIFVLDLHHFFSMCITFTRLFVIFVAKCFFFEHILCSVLLFY